MTRKYGPSQTVRAKAIRALLAAVDAAPIPFPNPADMRNVLTDDNSDPKLYVYQIVDVVVDSIIETMSEKEER